MEGLYEMPRPSEIDRTGEFKKLIASAKSGEDLYKIFMNEDVSGLSKPDRIEVEGLILLKLIKDKVKGDLGKGEFGADQVLREMLINTFPIKDAKTRYVAAFGENEWDKLISEINKLGSN